MHARCPTQQTLITQDHLYKLSHAFSLIAPKCGTLFAVAGCCLVLLFSSMHAGLCMLTFSLVLPVQLKLLFAAANLLVVCTSTRLGKCTILGWLFLYVPCYQAALASHYLSRLSCNKFVFESSPCIRYLHLPRLFPRISSERHYWLTIMIKTRRKYACLFSCQQVQLFELALSHSHLPSKQGHVAALAKAELGIVRQWGCHPTSYILPAASRCSSNNARP